MLKLKIVNARSPQASRLNWPVVHKLDDGSHVVPIDGPAHLAAHRRSGTGDVTVFQDKAANEVLAEADNQYKSGYPTIAASSMLARRNRIAQIPEESDQPDMKFFAELVKPMQYRWKFQKDKLKTLAPSKHGYHPRSQSPTFHRLVEATEKLQTLSQNVDDIFDDKFDTSELETQSQINLGDTEKTVLRYTRSEPYSTRSSNITSLPVPKGGTVEDSIITPDIKPLSLNRADEDETFIEEEEEEGCEESYQTPEESPTPPPRTNVKRQGHSRTIKKLESHTEIHLFLPQIQDQMSRDGTPDRDKRGGAHKLVLPVIKDSGFEMKALEEERSRPRKDRFKTEGKRKKKKASRIKSGVVDKEVPDILNDVPTLISMSKEPPGDYHPASMCVFENCQYHVDVKKSTRLRQP